MENIFSLLHNIQNLHIYAKSFFKKKKKQYAAESMWMSWYRRCTPQLQW